MACAALALLLTLSILLPGATASYIGAVCNDTWEFDGPSKNDHDGMTVAECVDYCHNAKEHMTIAALNLGSHCSCATTIPFEVHKNASDCISPGVDCTADDGLICGGNDWYSVYDAGANADVISNADGSDVIDALCPYDSNCTWTCAIKPADVAVAYVAANRAAVIGTEHYSSHSSFCLAAAHAGRYVIGQTSKVTGTRKKEAIPSESCSGSWYRGIQSEDCSSATPADYLEFTSAMIKPQTDLIVTGWVERDRSITCKYSGTNMNIHIIDAANGTVLANETARGEVNYQYSPDTTYFCALSNKVGVWLPTTFVPLLSSIGHDNQQMVVQTKKVGENASIEFDTAGVIYKNGKEISHSDSYNFTTSYGDAGFYELRSTSVDAASMLGLMRFIPTAEGPKKCKNQGMQRDDGTCVCFPPFSGHECENVCDTGKFGPSCAWDTPKGNPPFNGSFVCNQDPASCMCASGWTGNDCSTLCTGPGEYGPYCKGHATDSHCHDGEPVSPYTGNCNGSCAYGYCGDRCNSAVPGFDHGSSSTFTVEPSDSVNNVLVITWNIENPALWNDKGNVSCNYTCKNECSPDEPAPDSFTADLAAKNKSVTVRPYSNCSFTCSVEVTCERVTMTGESGNSSSETNMTAKPAAVDKGSFKGYPVEQGILLVWQVPPGEQDHLRGYVISKSSHLEESEVGDSTAHGADTSYIIRDVTLGTTYDVSIRANTSNGLSEPTSTTVQYIFPPKSTTPEAGQTSSATETTRTTSEPTSAAPSSGGCDNSTEKKLLIATIVFLAVVLLLLLLLIGVFFFFYSRRASPSYDG